MGGDRNRSRGSRATHVEYGRKNDTAHVSLAAGTADGTAGRQVPAEGIAEDAGATPAPDGGGQLPVTGVTGARRVPRAELPGEPRPRGDTARERRRCLPPGQRLPVRWA